MKFLSKFSKKSLGEFLLKFSQQNSIKKEYNKKGFGLIELSVIISAISVSSASSLSISSGKAVGNKVNITKERIDGSYKALGSYLLAKKRFPCPASLLEIKGSANYGVPGGASGNCNSKGVYKFSGSGNADIIYGMIPVKELGLNAEMAEDGLNGKIVYIIDQRFTNNFFTCTAGSCAIDLAAKNFATMDSSTAALTPLISAKAKVSGSEVTKTGIVLGMISYGIDQNGAFKSNSVTEPVIRTSTGGVSNYDDSTKNAPTNFGNGANPSVTLALPLISRSSNNFDDITLFKTRSEIIKDFNASSLTICKGLPTSGATLYFPKANAMFGEVVFASGGTNKLCSTNSARYQAKRCGGGDFSTIGSFSDVGCPPATGGAGVCTDLARPGITSGIVPGTTGNRTCGNGYGGTYTYSCSSAGVVTMTSGSCTLIACPISVTGVAPPPATVGSGSGTITCDVPNYTGTVNYTCTSTSTVSNPAPTITGSCQPQCYISGQRGYVDKWVNATAVTEVSCDIPDYYGSVTYSCPSDGSGNENVTGNTCKKDCSINVTGYNGSVTGNTSGTLTCQGNYTGNLSYSCSIDGNITSLTNNCIAQCNCNGSWINSGSQCDIADCGSGYSGTKRYTCNNGSWNYVNSSCLAQCNCNGTLINSGSQCDFADCASGYSGTNRYTCNNGSWNYASSNCTPNPCYSANGTTYANGLVYNNSGNVQISHGNTLNLVKTSSACGSYSGYFQFSCNPFCAFTWVNSYPYITCSAGSWSNVQNLNGIKECVGCNSGSSSNTLSNITAGWACASHTFKPDYYPYPTLTHNGSAIICRYSADVWGLSGLTSCNFNCNYVHQNMNFYCNNGTLTRSWGTSGSGDCLGDTWDKQYERKAGWQCGTDTCDSGGCWVAWD